jgi:hypothetical protein
MKRESMEMLFLLICGQNLNLKESVETWNELLQHSYSLSSLRDFKKKSRGFMMTLLKPLRSFK